MPCITYSHYLGGTQRPYVSCTMSRDLRAPVIYIPSSLSQAGIHAEFRQRRYRRTYCVICYQDRPSWSFGWLIVIISCHDNIKLNFYFLKIVQEKPELLAEAIRDILNTINVDYFFERSKL